MEITRDWDRALIYAGQGIRSEDVVKYATQLKEVDPAVLESNIDIAEKASGLPIADYLVQPDTIFDNNAALQMVVHTLNVSATDLAMRKITSLEDLAIAGHSLGEVAALDAAGVFPARTAGMEFVFARGTSMQQAFEHNPGSLYMIDGLTEEQVDKIALELEVATALINAPSLIFVASVQGRTDIEEPAKKAGARKVTDFHMPPFHTSYMLPAQVDLQTFCRDREYYPAHFYVVSNLDGLPELDGYKLMRNHITNIVNPVRWTDVIATILHPDVTFYTLGPGNILATHNRLNGVPKEQTKDLFQLLAE